MKNVHKLMLLSMAALIWNFAPIQSARAADTVETWDVGATDLDFYLGLDGIGLGEKEKTVFGDIMLGYGLIDRFSAYLGTTLEANEFFGDGAATIYLGVFGTPISTDHFDFDLFLDFSTGGPGLSEFQLNPSTELNFDLDPDMASWGMYLRAGIPIYGRESTSEEELEPISEAVYHIETTLGTYYTLTDGHQLLLEYDMAFRPVPADGEHDVEVGGFALGYNVLLHDSIEMINQIHLDLPQDNETTAWGLMTGIIATLPAGSL